jgi:hypothetical protein
MASCGGASPPRLADGSRAPKLPRALDGLEHAVMTRTVVKRESGLDQAAYRACGVPADGDRPVVERTGLHGSSLTIASRASLHACDEIPHPATAEDPDRPWGGVWCGGSVGRLRNGNLNDPRLDVCSSTENDLVAFVWAEPEPRTRWVVVSDGGVQEVYEVAASLPVRVTTTHGIDPAGRASFAVEEYSADGTKLREHTLEAQVAG